MRANECSRGALAPSLQVITPVRLSVSQEKLWEFHHSKQLGLLTIAAWVSTGPSRLGVPRLDPPRTPRPERRGK